MTKRAAALSQRAAAARPLTVAAGLVRALVLYAQALGLPERLAAETLGAHVALLSNPDHRVPSALYSAFEHACAKASGDADFGLHLGAASRLAHMGVLGFLLQASHTLGDALRAYERWQIALGETLRLRLELRGREVLLHVEAMDEAAAHRHRVESFVAGLHAVAHELCGRPLPWRAARFDHLHGSAPHHAGSPALQRLLGVVPTAGPTRLVLDADVLAWPVPHGGADPALAALLHGQLAQRTRALADIDIEARTTALLRRHLLRCARPDLAGTARGLGLSPRALQQQLQQAGTTFRALAEQVARDSATALLRQGSSAAETSHLLGFAEEAAFFRAFKRWTGQTPAQARSAAFAPRA